MALLRTQTPSDRLDEGNYIVWAMARWNEFASASGMDGFIPDPERAGCSWFKCPWFEDEEAGTFGFRFMTCSRCRTVSSGSDYIWLSLIRRFRSSTAVTHVVVRA